VSTVPLLPSEQLHAMAEAFGDETGYRVVGGSSLTFAEWDSQATRLARGLIASGLEPDDRVTIHMDPTNALRWVVTYAAVHRAGGVAVPFNPQLTAPEVARMIDHCGAAATVAEESLLSRYDGARPALMVAVPPARGGTATDAEDRKGVVGWSDVLDDDASYFQVQRDPGDLADILYTSGTTGHPKAVAVRHDNASLVPFGKPSWNGGGWLHASPPYTFAGLSFVYTPMKMGMKVLFQPRFDAGEWLETVESEKPIAVFLVPAMAHLLLEHPRFGSADLSSVSVCSVGSAPLAPFVLEQLQERMPTALVSNNYGMTEAGSVYCIMPPGEAVKRPGSVGKPAPPAEIRCVDGDGAEVPAGEVGEVRLRIPGRPRE
jgi:acyl-CoA synthetase (AMP-forming)/AMP-acid ligase II